MKITNIEAIYVSQKTVRKQCDSGQDALIIRVSTDAGITGLGEVDSAPLAAREVIGGPYSHTISTGLKHLLIGEDPFQTEFLWHKMYQGNIYAGRRGIAKDARTDIALVAQARQGLGEDADLMIDAGLVWDARTAIERARSFADYRLFWLEEPLQSDDYEGYRRLSEARIVAIAAGEQECSRYAFLDLMDKGKVDVVQVDLTRCGGFTEAMRIASLAADRGLKVANHGFSTYINVMAALHWLNAIPNALIAEFVVQESTDLREFITRQKLKAIDGYLPIPEEPGLGIDLDEEQIARFRVV
jgi:L-alanine-DL-glutamate epimerase-like enolase superfamily enzyme